MNYIHLKNISFVTENSIRLVNGKCLLSQLGNSPNKIRNGINGIGHWNSNFTFQFCNFNSFDKKIPPIILNRNLNTLSPTKKYPYQPNVLINSNNYELNEQLCKTVKFNLYNCSSCNLYAQPKPKEIECEYDIDNIDEDNVSNYEENSSESVDKKRQSDNSDSDDELTILLNSNDNFFVKEWKQIKSFVWHLIFGSQVFVHEVQQSMELKQKRIDNVPLSRRESLLIRRSFHDSLCVIPFFLFLATEPYYLYLFCSIFPTLIPSVYVTPHILKRNFEKNKKHRKRIAKSAAKLEPWVSFDVKVLHDENRIYQLSKTDNMEMKQFDVDSLSWWHLKSCAGYLGLFSFLPKSILKIRIDEYLDYIKSDDEFINEEGIESLSLDELRLANEQRGFNSLGLTKEELKANLTHWINFFCNNERIIIPRIVMILSHIYSDNVKFQSEMNERKELRKIKRKEFLHKYFFLFTKNSCK